MKEKEKLFEYFYNIPERFHQTINDLEIVVSEPREVLEQENFILYVVQSKAIGPSLEAYAAFTSSNQVFESMRIAMNLAKQKGKVALFIIISDFAGVKNAVQQAHPGTRVLLVKQIHPITLKYFVVLGRGKVSHWILDVTLKILNATPGKFNHSDEFPRSITGYDRKEIIQKAVDYIEYLESKKGEAIIHNLDKEAKKISVSQQ